MTRFKLSIIVALLLSFANAYAQVNVEQLMRQAQFELFNDNYFETVKTCSKIITYRPNNHEAYYFRGIAKYNLSDYKGAQSDFLYTTQLNPFYSHAYHLLGKTEVLLGNYAKAVAYYNHTIKLSPYMANAYLDRGLTYYRIKQYHLANADLDSAITLNTNLPTAFFAKSIVEEALGDSLSALKYINKAIQINPFFDEAILKRAVLNYNLNRYDDALSDIALCLRLDKENPEAYFQRAIIYSKQEQYKEALLDYNKTILLDKQNAIALYNRALLYYQIQNYDKAIDDFSMAAKINPNNILVLYGRALAYYESKQYGRAQQDLTTIIDIYPMYNKAYLLRSVIFDKLGHALASNTDKQKYQELMGIGESLPDWHKDSASVAELIKLDGDFVAVDKVKQRQIQYADSDANLRPDVVFMYRLMSYDYPLFDNIKEHQYRSGNYQMVYYFDISKNLLDSLVSLYESKHKDYFVNFVLGTCYGLQNDFNKAEAYLSEAIFQNPDFAYSYANRAYFSSKLKEMQAQIDDEHQHALSIGSTSYNLPSQAVSQAEIDEQRIIFDYRRAAALSSELMMQYNLANALAINQQYTEALIIYGNIAKKAPRFSKALFNKALVEIKLNNRKAACRSLSQAGEAGEKDVYPLIKKFCK